LDKVSDGNPELREHLAGLLQMHEQLGGFLEAPAHLPDATTEPPAAAPGTLIGSYKLLEQIGEGGMGLVYVAEQQQPVKRRVALKIIKPGMDSRQVIARFEAERQALALMDHPNIAKILDGGTIPSQISDLRFQIDNSGAGSDRQSEISNLKSLPAVLLSSWS
jgi:serine/threonine protein kinase